MRPKCPRRNQMDASSGDDDGGAEHVKKHTLNEVGVSRQADAFPSVDQTVYVRSQEITHQATFACAVDIALGDKRKFADDDICGLQIFSELPLESNGGPKCSFACTPKMSRAHLGHRPLQFPHAMWGVKMSLTEYSCFCDSTCGKTPLQLIGTASPSGAPDCNYSGCAAWGPPEAAIHA
jgi:hypothetical protein